MAKTFSPDYDLKLIQAVQQTGDNESMKALICEHSGLYALTLDQSLSSDYAVYKQEMLEDKDFFMYQWAKNFNPDKHMKYPVWVAQNVKWRCMNIVNRSKPWEMLEEGSFDCSYEQQIEDVEQKVLDEIVELSKVYPDNRIATIINERYFKNRKPTSWKDLSIKLKTSPNSLLTLHKNFLKWAAPMMKKYI